jgi:Flp pilus assembly protein CpaB
MRPGEEAAMRTVPLFTALCLVTASPVQAAPPVPTSPPPQATDTQAPASHNRIGAMMGSLTRALREAAEERQMQTRRATTAQLNDPSTSTPVTQAPTTSLPPDASAQAAVP